MAGFIRKSEDMGKTRTSNERQQSNEKQESCESVKIGRVT